MEYKKRSPMIRRLERHSYEDEEARGEKIFKGVSLGICLLASVYFGQGVLKGLGKIENENMAKKIGVAPIEQSYTGYLSLGTKNLVERIYSTFR
jgi:hypothetical protein